MEAFTKDTILDSGKIILKFSALWCVPCHTLDSILNNIESNNLGISIYNIDIEENPDLVDQYHIKSIPTLIYFRDGEIIHELIGVQSKENILKYFNE